MSGLPYSDFSNDVHTSCLHAALADGDGNPLVTPIVQSTTFCRDGVGSTATHQYSRCSNPTVAALEGALGSLENALPATCFATGLAAESALFFALLTGGDHVVCGRTVYGGTTRLLQQILPGLGVTTTFVDATNTQEVIDAIRPETKLVFLETPANPTLELTDIRTITDAVRAKNEGKDENKILVAVDNTFLTAVLQQPLELGADISVYSTTKFIEGHSAALGGALVTRDEKLAEKFVFIRKCTGAIQSPLGAWLTLQGLKTLPVRLQRQSTTAGKLATWLESNDQIKAIHYPGLESFAQKELATAQHREIEGERLHGAVVTIELAGGIEAAKVLLANLKLCRFVEHVGSVETLVTHPATMTHADVPAEERRASGVLDGLLRISVGLEGSDALIADWANALGQIGGACQQDTAPIVVGQEVKASRAEEAAECVA